MRPIQAKNYSQVSINCLPGKAIEDVEKEKAWLIAAILSLEIQSMEPPVSGKLGL
ncbi:MAG: hypothetical protein ACLURP_04820 [Ruminococcus sp.]